MYPNESNPPIRPPTHPPASQPTPTQCAVKIKAKVPVEIVFHERFGPGVSGRDFEAVYGSMTVWYILRLRDIQDVARWVVESTSYI